MRKVPFTREWTESVCNQYPTPFYVYDEEGIRRRARKLIGAFSWNEGFKEYYAVKALPNPVIVRLLKEEGCGADCSSLAELKIAQMAGLSAEDIMFTSNDTPAAEFTEAKALGAIINLDDVHHLEYLETHAGLPELISFRYNPGPSIGGNEIIGDPKEAKFGVTQEQLFDGYRRAKQKGVKRFGLHTMLISNELNANYFITAADLMFTLARQIEDSLGITFEFINLGGGIGIPYRPDSKEVDLECLSKGTKEAYEKAFAGRTGPRIYLECGRFITGPFGYLITKVRHVKHTYKAYAGVDACMADLMRPGMYGAYHHITVLGKESLPVASMYDVVGSLCENNDKFAVDRTLPTLVVGDILAVHDAGAHGHAMGFNYNGKLRPAELLMQADGSVKLIRRAETLDDYFTTLVG